MDSVENHSSSADVCPRLSFGRDLMPLSILLVLFAGPTSDDPLDFGSYALSPKDIRYDEYNEMKSYLKKYSY